MEALAPTITFLENVQLENAVLSAGFPSPTPEPKNPNFVCVDKLLVNTKLVTVGGPGLLAARFEQHAGGEAVSIIVL